MFALKLTEYRLRPDGSIFPRDYVYHVANLVDIEAKLQQHEQNSVHQLDENQVIVGHVPYSRYK
jgi:hypothetical protein